MAESDTGANRGNRKSDGADTPRMEHLRKHSRWHVVGAPDFRAIEDFLYTVGGALIRATQEKWKQIMKSGNESKDFSLAEEHEAHPEDSWAKFEMRSTLAEVYEEITDAVRNEDGFISVCGQLYQLDKDPSNYEYVNIARKALEEIQMAAWNELGQAWNDPYFTPTIVACFRDSYHDTEPTVVIRPGIVDVGSSISGISLRLTPIQADILANALENENTSDNQYPFGKWSMTLSGLNVELSGKRLSDGRRVLTWRGEPNFGGVLLIEEKPNDTYPCGENLANLLRRSREIASIWEESGDLPEHFVRHLKEAGVLHFEANGTPAKSGAKKTRDEEF